MNEKIERSNNIEEIIREYLLDEGILRKKLQNNEVAFGFQFVFPLVHPQEKFKKSQSMVVFQPKKKNDLLIVLIATQISHPHVEALQKKNDGEIIFFKKLKKFLHLKNVFFYLDIKNHRYEISDQVFLTNNFISKNDFFLLIRRIFNIQAYTNLMLLDFCSVELKAEHYDNSTKYDSGSHFSLYS
jgi:hypothetical protein